MHDRAMNFPLPPQPCPSDAMPQNSSAPEPPAKLWAGRFSESASAPLDKFWSSIAFDKKLAPYDIKGSIAHARMLGKTGIVSFDESAQLIAGLQKIRDDLLAGTLILSDQDEDIHMNIERLLHERIGALAGKLHTARSRNDQVALDMHMFVRANCLTSIELLLRFQKMIWDKATANLTVIMPGYTHLQRAQPVMLAHHLMAYFWMFQRDIDRVQDCLRRTNISPLGAGALAGTTFPIDRQMVADELGFAGVYANSMDAVSDRDYILDCLSANATIAMHLSRLCEEVILWTSSEFGFVILSDAFSSGSSMMPQKKNPDLAELVRGKTGRVYAALIGMLTTLKGLPLTYNKDMQEDKEGLFDSLDTVQNSLLHLCDMVESMKINADEMQNAADQGFLDATDAADYLAKRGVPFREAHEIVGKLVRLCIDGKRSLKELSLDELHSYSAHFAEDFYRAIELTQIVSLRKSEGGTAPDKVIAQMKLAAQNVGKTTQWLNEMKAKE
jgi:argininosuccinate lyase